MRSWLRYQTGGATCLYPHDEIVCGVWDTEKGLWWSVMVEGIPRVEWCRGQPWCRTVRLPQPIPGLKKLIVRTWGRVMEDAGHWGDDIGEVVRVELQDARANYFARRLMGMGDREAAEDVWRSA